MTLVLEREPTTGSPILPPYLRKKGPERRRVIILPDIIRIEQATDVFDHQNNWKTTVYQWMDRIIGDSVFDPTATWQCAHITTRTYRQWLETYDTENGLPPHISFGGCIVAGEADLTFYPRWLEYAKATFC